MFKIINKHLMTCLAGIVLFTASITASADINWTKAITSSFETLGSDVREIQKKTRGYSTSGWYRTSVLDVAAVGAGACAIPVGSYAALPAEFLYFMREIYNSTLGMGYLIHGDANKSDFANILAIWADEKFQVEDKTLHKIYGFAEEVAPDVVQHVLEKRNKTASLSPYVAAGTAHKHASSHLVSKMIAKKSGAKVGGKLSTKVGAKAGAKIGSKYATKTMTAWIPFVSAAVCSGLNGWIMSDILDTAEVYYKQLARVEKQRYGSR